MPGGKKGKGGKGASRELESKPLEQFNFNFATNAPQEPGYNSILDFNTPDGLKMLNSIRSQLGGLVGQDSGYFQTLPQPVQNRISALKKLHKDKVVLDNEFKKELEALEKKFAEKLQPLYDRRAIIVEGSVEPTAEEIAEGKKAEEETAKKNELEKKAEGEKIEDKKEEKKEIIKKDPKDLKPIEKEDAKGIPGFWLEALRHNDDFEGMITERDEDALMYLKNIIEKPLHEEEGKGGFCLEFHFGPNPYFEETILSKTYFIDHHEAIGELFDKAEATEIQWKTDKNLTITKVEKKAGKRGGGRRGRGGKDKGRQQTIIVEEPCASFFNFFSPDTLVDDDMEQDEMEAVLEADYEMGLAVKESIIPNAVMWFTGEIQRSDSFYDDEEDEEDEEEYDEDDSEGEDANFALPPGIPNEEKPECKQQ